MSDDKQDNKGPDNKDQATETPDGDRVIRTVGRDFRVEGNDVDGYIGVDPEYRNYANSTDRPYITDEDVALLEKGGFPTDVEKMTLANSEQSRREAVNSETAQDEPAKETDKGDESGDKADEDKKSDAEKKDEKPAATATPAAKPAASSSSK